MSEYSQKALGSWFSDLASGVIGTPDPIDPDNVMQGGVEIITRPAPAYVVSSYIKGLVVDLPAHIEAVKQALIESGWDIVTESTSTDLTAADYRFLGPYVGMFTDWHVFRLGLRAAGDEELIFTNPDEAKAAFFSALLSRNILSPSAYVDTAGHTITSQIPSGADYTVAATYFDNGVDWIKENAPDVSGVKSSIDNLIIVAGVLGVAYIVFQLSQVKKVKEALL